MLLGWAYGLEINKDPISKKGMGSFCLFTPPIRKKTLFKLNLNFVLLGVYNMMSSHRLHSSASRYAAAVGRISGKDVPVPRNGSDKEIYNFCVLKDPKPCLENGRRKEMEDGCST